MKFNCEDASFAADRVYTDLSAPALPVMTDDAGMPGRDCAGPSLLLWLIAHAPPCPAEYLEFGPEDFSDQDDVAAYHAHWALEWASKAYECAHARLHLLNCERRQAFAALRAEMAAVEGAFDDFCDKTTPPLNKRPVAPYAAGAKTRLAAEALLKICFEARDMLRVASASLCVDGSKMRNSVAGRCTRVREKIDDTVDAFFGGSDVDLQGAFDDFCDKTTPPLNKRPVAPYASGSDATGTHLDTTA